MEITWEDYLAYKSGETTPEVAEKVRAALADPDSELNQDLAQIRSGLRAFGDAWHNDEAMRQLARALLRAEVQGIGSPHEQPGEPNIGSQVLGISLFLLWYTVHKTQGQFRAPDRGPEEVYGHLKSENGTAEIDLPAAFARAAYNAEAQKVLLRLHMIGPEGGPYEPCLEVEPGPNRSLIFIVHLPTVGPCVFTVHPPALPGQAGWSDLGKPLPHEAIALPDSQSIQVDVRLPVE